MENHPFKIIIRGTGDYSRLAGLLTDMEFKFELIQGERKLESEECAMDIEKLYRHVIGDEKGVWLQASTIREKVNTVTRKDYNDKMIGSALKSLDFKRQSKRIRPGDPVKAYCVVEIDARMERWRKAQEDRLTVSGICAADYSSPDLFNEAVKLAIENENS